MASLDFFIRKFGAARGKKKYNAYHQEYRNQNRTKLALYQRNRRAAQKGSIQAPSQPSEVIPS
jgi:hypothetical protein